MTEQSKGYQVEMRSYDDPRQWEPIGEVAEDAIFPSEDEAEEWIAENIIYREDEGATRDNYRIIEVL